MLLKRYSAAWPLLENATKINPDSADAWYDLAYCLLELERPLESLNCFANLVSRLDCSRASVWAGQGQALFDLARYEEALASYSRALSIEPGAGHWSRHGLVNLRLGRHQEALRDIERALEIDPKLREALCNRAALLIVLERYEDARRRLEHFLALYPDDPCGLELMQKVTVKLRAKVSVKGE